MKTSDPRTRGLCGLVHGEHTTRVGCSKESHCSQGFVPKPHPVGPVLFYPGPGALITKVTLRLSSAPSPPSPLYPGTRRVSSRPVLTPDAWSFDRTHESFLIPKWPGRSTKQKPGLGRSCYSSCSCPALQGFLEETSLASVFPSLTSDPDPLLDRATQRRIHCISKINYY